jgi:Ser/Thr protein kinase RdoA (MazF antagonist)
MKHDDDTPFSTLTPDFLLSAIEQLGLEPDGRLLALNSFENRVYQVGMVQGPALVAKFYRPERWSNAAILEEHAFVADLARREIPVVAPLLREGRTLFVTGDARFSLFPWQGGRAPEFDDEATLGWMGRFLGRIHAVGALTPYVERPVLDISSFGEEPRDFVLDNGFVPEELEEVYAGVVDQALDGVWECIERAGDVPLLRLHGDCHVGNVLWTDQGPHFVDFDDSRMGPAIQDLWMLLSGHRDDMSRQLKVVLAGYRQFHDFDPQELHLVEAMRTLRLIHHAGWIALRWHDPAFPAAFPWFSSPRYWQDRILELREQIALMEEGPLLVA